MLVAGKVLERMLPGSAAPPSASAQIIDDATPSQKYGEMRAAVLCHVCTKEAR